MDPSAGRMSGGPAGTGWIAESNEDDNEELIDMDLGPWAMGIFLVLLAVILIGVFAGVWLRDRNRSHEVGDDPSRLRNGRRR
jgi:hypothetical protein